MSICTTSEKGVCGLSRWHGYDGFTTLIGPFHLLSRAGIINDY